MMQKTGVIGEDESWKSLEVGLDLTAQDNDKTTEVDGRRQGLNVPIFISD